MFTPAMRAMFYLSSVVGVLDQPCRCLWRASAVQMTRTTPWRRTILQLRQIFLTDASTFMFVPLSLLRAERDPRPRQVVRRELDRHLVARKDLDVVHAHLS